MPPSAAVLLAIDHCWIITITIITMMMTMITIMARIAGIIASSPLLIVILTGDDDRNLYWR